MNKYITYITVLFLLSSCSETNEGENNKVGSTQEVVNDNINNNSNSYPEEVNRINDLVNSIENLTDNSPYHTYIFYDENGEKYLLGINERWEKNKNYSLSITPNPDELASGESHVSTTLYFENNLLCLFRIEEIGHDFWQDDRHDNYYFQNLKRDLFYNTKRHLYKGEFVSDTGAALTQFEGDGNYILWERKNIEELLETAISQNNFVEEKDFNLKSSGFINGSDDEGICERTEIEEYLEFIYLPEGIDIEKVAPEARGEQYKSKLSFSTVYDEASMKCKISGNYDYKHQKNTFEYQFNGTARGIGAIDQYIFLETNPSPFEGTFDLIVFNSLTSKVEYKQFIRGLLYRHHELYILKKLKDQQTTGRGYDGGCMKYMSEGYGKDNYEKCGVFRLKLGQYKEIFTNQIFCSYVQ